MKIASILLLLWAASLASVGSVFVKLGAGGTRIVDFFNWKIGLALCFYFAAMISWLMGLSNNRLSTVYPFTAVSIVIVYLLSVLVLREPITWRGALGTVLVILGVTLVVGAQG